MSFSLIIFGKSRKSTITKRLLKQLARRYLFLTKVCLSFTNSLFFKTDNKTAKQVKMAEWQRSAAIPYPHIWYEFEVFNPALYQMQSFSIMDIPENYHDRVITQLARFIMKSAPIKQQHEMLADQISIVEREAWWRMALKQRLSLMCVWNHTDGSQVIVAVSINTRRSIYDTEPEFKGKRMKWLWSTREYIYGKRNFYEDFNVVEVMVPVGAFTIPGFHLTPVSVNMWKCRSQLCKATGINLSLASFAIGNIRNCLYDAAAQAGYNEYVRLPYEEMASIDTTLPTLECAFITLMYIFCE